MGERREGCCWGRKAYTHTAARCCQSGRNRTKNKPCCPMCLAHCAPSEPKGGRRELSAPIFFPCQRECDRLAMVECQCLWERATVRAGGGQKGRKMKVGTVVERKKEPRPMHQKEVPAIADRALTASPSTMVCTSCQCVWWRSCFVKGGKETWPCKIHVSPVNYIRRIDPISTWVLVQDGNSLGNNTAAFLHQSRSDFFFFLILVWSRQLLE